MATTRIMSPEERARRSAGAKRAKARLKADPAANAQFKERTAKAVTIMWSEGQESRKANISKAKRLSNDAMTTEERKQKYGWMNAPHVTNEKKYQIWECSLKKWHDEAPPEVYAAMVERRTKSILQKEGPLIYDNNFAEDHSGNAWLSKHPNPFAFDQIFEVA